MQHFLVQVKLETKKLLLFKKSHWFSFQPHPLGIIANAMSINVQDFKRVMLSNKYIQTIIVSQ